MKRIQRGGLIRRISAKKHLQARRITDFSIIEDKTGSFDIIGNLAASAGKKAAAKARAKGLSIVYARGNKLVQVKADGSVESVTPKSKRDEYFVQVDRSKKIYAGKK